MIVDRSSGKRVGVNQYTVLKAHNYRSINSDIDTEKFWGEGKEEGMEIEHFCYHFGCGRPLSLIESLCGNYCTSHMGSK